MISFQAASILDCVPIYYHVLCLCYDDTYTKGPQFISGRPCFSNSFFLKVVYMVYCLDTFTKHLTEQHYCLLMAKSMFSADFANTL